MFCRKCGKEVPEGVKYCPNCGCPVDPNEDAKQTINSDGTVGESKSYIAAGVLNLFIPGVGRLYLGYTGIGVAELLVGIFTCGIGCLWSFIDGILILCGNVKYDGHGNPLRQ